MVDAVSLTEEYIEKLLTPTEECDVDIKRLYEAMRYTALGGGKRVRATLTMDFYSACSGSDDVTAAIPYAAAIELIHAASLIHDDMPEMDNDDMRRGKPSNHKVFGTAQAMLAGDALFIKAFEAVADNPCVSPSLNAKAVRLMSSLSGVDGMCGGQMIDIENTGKEIDETTLERLEELKTSALISCACGLGVIAAGGNKEQSEAAAGYAKYLGLAFQIRDDILDVEGDEKSVGKTLHKDADAEKTTFVTLFGLDGAKKLCEEFTEKSVKCLETFGYNEYTDALRGFAYEMAERSK